ncbi:MAG: lipid IV(A) 3-deoxy-D-manno-octulosonic acid transferase [Rhodocyclaceae bacterium]|nr:lipid IV(A) 3-deoxy-D-manno-octulosonic acid transferase [Rhodocyclaceae bacterium]
MARLFYTLLVHLLLPFAFAHLLWRARRQPEYRRDWPERMGVYRGVAHDAPLIWLHAVSVGETRAAQPLLAALRRSYPRHRFLVTQMTPTGRAMAAKLFGEEVECAYLPYDLPWAMRRFLRHYRPSLGLILETEVWPNLVAECARAGVPILLVNARLSERSLQRYLRWPKLIRETMQGFAAIGAQSEADRERFLRLGAQEVVVTGNLKFDVAWPKDLPDFSAFCAGRRVFLCASTRAGEEERILDAWRAAQPRIPEDVLLVMVPRHPQRFDEVARLIERAGFSLQRRSQGAPIARHTQVWLGDSLGELPAYYRVADVAFVGGTLLDHGGQNLIEPCALGVPTLIGTSTFNFAEAAASALACGAVRQIGQAAELVDAALMLLGDAQARAAMSKAGVDFAARHRGATEKTLALVATRLPIEAQ